MRNADALLRRCCGHDSMTYVALAEYSPAMPNPMSRRATNIMR